MSEDAPDNISLCFYSKHTFWTLVNISQVRNKIIHNWVFDSIFLFLFKFKWQGIVQFYNISSSNSVVKDFCIPGIASITCFKKGGFCEALSYQKKATHLQRGWDRSTWYDTWRSKNKSRDIFMFDEKDGK